MVALIFIILGGLILLIAAGRIWMSATPGTLKETNSSIADKSDVADSRHRV